MGWEEVAAACRAELPIAGIVESRKKGGFRVRLASGIVAFLPLSQADCAIVREPASLVGKAFDFLVVRCNLPKKSVVLSRRRLLERARDMLKYATLNSLAEGQIVSGVVSNVTDYGFFVDVGGIIGLVHITQMERIRPFVHPSEVVSAGDVVLVRVQRFNPETERLELSTMLTRPSSLLIDSR